MSAFPENRQVTESYNYLRKEAQDRNLNRCFDHVKLETVLKMNELGNYINGIGRLHCLWER